MLTDTNKEREEIQPYNEEEKLDEFFNSSSASSFVMRVFKLNDPRLATSIRDFVSETTLSHSDIIQDLKEAKNPLFICISIFNDIILVCDRSGNLEFLRSEKNRILNNKELEQQVKYYTDFRPSLWPPGQLAEDILRLNPREDGIQRHIRPIENNNDPPPEIVTDEVSGILESFLSEGFSLDDIVEALEHVIDDQ